MVPKVQHKLHSNMGSPTWDRFLGEGTTGVARTPLPHTREGPNLTARARLAFLPSMNVNTVLQLPRAVVASSGSPPKPCVPTRKQCKKFQNAVQVARKRCGHHP